MTIRLLRLPWLALAVVLATLSLGLFVNTARADDPALRAAKRHFDRGEKLFALGKFDEALDQYQKAYDAKPIPDFLFNIGQCHRNLGDYDAAIFSFKKYLQLEPQASDREKVESLIDELEKKKAEAESKRLKLTPNGPNGPTGPTGPTESEAPIYKKWWFWTGVAVVAVGGGVGIYAATASKGAPSTTFGNMVFEK
jgi:tetratricopeptide (TPR) repeat protein